MSSESSTSSTEYALRQPDPGQRALDERVKGAGASERARLAGRLRRKAFVLVNQAADEAGPMSELDRAVFILRRLYPEFGPERLAFIRAELAKRHAEGRWSGFVRPSRQSGDNDADAADAPRIGQRVVAETERSAPGDG